MVDLKDPMIVRELLLCGLVQLLENRFLTPLMEQLLAQMEEPPNVQSLKGWVPDVQAWLLATNNIRRCLMGLRLVDLGDQGVEEANYEPMLASPEETEGGG